MPAPTSREIRERVLTLRQEKVPNAKIASELNISISTICKFVKNGIERKERKKGYRIANKRVNKFNDDFFEKIDTDEKAYWLGMFFSDGSVCKDKNCHSYRSVLSLDSRDAPHLEKLLTAIDFDRSLGRIFISNRKNFDTKMARVQLLSEKMFNDLISLGCVPSKSRILMPPKIDSNFDKPFLRGFFDGDGGSSFMVNEKLFGCTINFVGTKPVLDYISDIIYNETGIKGSFVKVQDWTYRLVYGGVPQVFKFFDWLYDDFNNTCLERKLEKAKDMMKVYSLKGKEKVLSNTQSKIPSEELYRIIERFLGAELLDSIFSQALENYSAKEFYNLYLQKVSEGLFYSKN